MARSRFRLDISVDERDLDALFTPHHGLLAPNAGASRVTEEGMEADDVEVEDAEADDAEADDAEADDAEATPGARDAPHDPIDWSYLYRLAEDGPMYDIIDHYFRARIIGQGKLPDEGPIVAAPNHSGNAFPHDAIVLDALMWRRDGLTKASKFRSVYTPQLAATWWMRPFDMDNWWRRVGGVDMTVGNFDRLLRRGDRLIYYPEGVPGIAKGFLRRYQLQPFSRSFVLMAARHDAPVYPISIVNAEWVNPTSITFETIDVWCRKHLGIPFLPLPIAPLAALLPFVFYLAFPCQMTFVVQDPIDVRAMLREAGCTDLDDPDRRELARVAEQVRRRCQSMLDDAVAEYGQKPYDLSSLVRELWALGTRALAATPLGWPVSYGHHERNVRRDREAHGLWGAVQDADLAAWYLPLGWLAVALLRELRRPPCGYRGLDEDERRATEGSYRWSLKDDPLPERADRDGGKGEWERGE